MRWKSILAAVLFLCASQAVVHGQTVVFVVRHAQAVRNVSHKPNLTPAQLDQLTKAGKKQAAKLGDELKSKGIVAVVTGPPHRVQQTGQIIADKIGVNQIKVDDRLAPLRHGMMMDSKSHGATTQPVEAETLADGVQRAKSLLVQLGIEFQGRSVVVVTTGDIAAGLLGEAAGTPVDQRLQKNEIPGGTARQIVVEGNHLYEKSVLAPGAANAQRGK